MLHPVSFFYGLRAGIQPRGVRAPEGRPVPGRLTAGWRGLWTGF